MTRLATVPGSEFSQRGGVPYLPRAEDVLAEVAPGLELPLPEFSHEQFMRDHRQGDWLDEFDSLIVRLKTDPPAVKKPRARKK